MFEKMAPGKVCYELFFDIDLGDVGERDGVICDPGVCVAEVSLREKSV